MIIGFLGKGGSGKTTLATLYTKYLIDKENFSHVEKISVNGNRVLALDNDHNMDFKFNLGFEGDMKWMGQSLQELFEKIAITSTKDVTDIDEEHIFSLSPIDNITEKYSTPLSENLRLMVSGPHTEEMMYGNMCSHGLTTPLKVYLPFLKLADHEYVIVDEKAGTDGVGTGVTTGFNAAVVVAEATTHGVKAAKQIIDMLKFYKTPYIVAINKLRKEEDGEKFIKEFSDYSPIEILTFGLDFDTIDLKLSENYKKEFRKMYESILKLNDDRKERTRERIRKQKEFNENKSGSA